MTNLKGGGPEKFGAVRSFFYQLGAEPSLEPLHRRIAAEIPIEQGRLLDVGCGPGNLDRLLAARAPGLAVVGVDESEAMIRRAERRHRPANLEFRRGAVENLGLREEFDFALSVLSFHHWEEPEAGLEAVHGALRPGGRFWIYEGDPEASLGGSSARPAPALRLAAAPGEARPQGLARTWFHGGGGRPGRPSRRRPHVLPDL